MGSPIMQGLCCVSRMLRAAPWRCRNADLCPWSMHTLASAAHPTDMACDRVDPSARRAVRTPRAFSSMCEVRKDALVGERAACGIAASHGQRYCGHSSALPGIRSRAGLQPLPWGTSRPVGPVGVAVACVPPTQLMGAAGQQIRFAGRIWGLKRKKKSDYTRTVQQKGLGKRIEMYWPKKAHRLRVPMYENSRRHVVWDQRLRRWMVMWYRNGIQVFRWFSARGGGVKFEQARMQAIACYQQLQNAGKLGRPKPDQNRAGVRGVYFDKEERSWVARWSDQGLQKHAVFNTQEMGFSEAYKEAVRWRIQSIRQVHKFVLQRTRWRGKRQPLGTPRT